MRPILTLLLSALPAALAVYKDEVGDIDFHHELVGLPQQDTTFFHRPRRDDRASLLYTLSDLGILGAINPSSGAALWRQQLPEDADGVRHLRAAEGEGWVASASGDTVQAWDAVSGRNVWSRGFEGEEVRDLEVMEMAVEGEGHKDVLALYYKEDGGVTTLRRLRGTDGAVVWEFREVTKDLPLQVSTNLEKVFVVGLHGSLGSYGLKVAVLDVPTGKRMDDISIATKSDIQSSKDLILVGANSAMPIVAWTDNALTTLRVNVLGTKAKHDFPLAAGTKSVEIHAPHSIQSDPHFLVHMRTDSSNTAEVFHIDLKTAAIKKAYDLPLLAGKGAFSTSSDGANVYFTRITQSEAILLASTSEKPLARWALKSGKVAEDNAINAVHAVSEVIKKSESSFAVRAAVLTDADDWVMVQNGQVAWSKPEGLTGAVAGAWAEIPESEDLAKSLEAEAHSSPVAAYIHRVQRHINDLEHLPDYLNKLPQRFINSLLGTHVGGNGKKLERDGFGFNKIVIIATERGTVYGLNAGDRGQTLWRHKVEDPSNWDVQGMNVDNSQGTVTIRASNGQTLVLKTDNGQVLDTTAADSTLKLQSVALVDSASGPYLLSIPKDGQIGPLAADKAPKQTLVVRGGETSLRGVKFLTAEDSTEATEVTTWVFNAPKGEKIVEIATRPQHDPVASIGRILGDRRVLYKYLNPNTIVVLTADPTASTMTTYLLDTVSGETLSSSTYEGIDTTQPASCTMSENFFICTMFGDYTLREDPNQSIKGHLLTVTDLYESESPDDRGPLGDAANFSSIAPLDDPTAPMPLPKVISQTWVLGAPISALAFSVTRQGISSRQLLAYLPHSRQIAGFHRGWLEPRRPVGRDPTPQELEEGLSRYAPAIEIDPKTVVSHELEILGVRSIVTSPAIVESTSLVLAYGVDVYVTRVAPSYVFDILGKGFNKISLIGTVLALSAGVAALGPMVSSAPNLFPFTSFILISTIQRLVMF